MLSQTIRTSKYTTTIDIPAEKLQTHAKFIQIPKNQPQPYEETICIKCCDQDSNGENRQSAVQTRMIIEELEKAYNEDMEVYENKLQNQKEEFKSLLIEKESIIESLKANLLRETENGERAKVDYQRTSSNFQKQVSKLEGRNSQLKRENQAQQDRIKGLEETVQDLRRQKQEISNVKIQEFVTAKEGKLNSKIFALQEELSRNKQQNVRLQSVEQALKELEIGQKKLTEERDFQSKEIQGYLSQLKNLENDKEHLQRVVSRQDSEISQLLVEMREQGKVIEQLREEKMLREEKTLREEENRMLIDKQAEQQRVDSSNDMKELVARIVDLEELAQRKENLVLESEAKYLLKLKENDALREEVRLSQKQAEQGKAETVRLSDMVENLKVESEKLAVELSKKVLECNELLSKPPEQKVYEVKIEKSVDRKEYIEQLEHKVRDLQKLVEELKDGNESYVEEIQKRLKIEANLRKKQGELEKSVLQLRELIERKQNSISWVVQREIQRDIELTRQVNEQNHKGDRGQSPSRESKSLKSSEHSYKVKVKEINYPESSSNELSGIQARKQYDSRNYSRKEAVNAVNISIESNVERILERDGAGESNI